MPSFILGEGIPPDTPHAVSVSLPTWKSNIGYEEAQEWVMSRLTAGYPRFFIHKSISTFADEIVAAFGQPNQQAMLFPTQGAAQRCLDFMCHRATPELSTKFTTTELTLDPSNRLSFLDQLSPGVYCVLHPRESYPLAKQYWQHTGDGISSRRAEFCYDLFKRGLLIQPQKQPPCIGIAKPFRGPKRYFQSRSSGGFASESRTADVTLALPAEDIDESRESFKFLEERFGRNLDISMVERAELAIRRRIAGFLVHHPPVKIDAAVSSQTSSREINRLKEDDVYLFPAGMNAIFNAHRALLAALGSLESVNFGFPYVDTLKILEKFGPGCLLYGHASTADLDDLEKQLKRGRQFLALFCEFPGNPLLTCPNLKRIRKLANEFNFAIVVDETIGTFANVNVLQYADIVVSSLTKIFSGDSNVMGGCAIFNPESKYYKSLKHVMDGGIYEKIYWPEDVVFMERNSRDFSSRVKRINANAEAICDILQDHKLVRSLYYPKHNLSRANYDECRLPSGGYGGLISVVFNYKHQAEAFYDSIDTAKGPSLGTNFTLCSPYVLLAHYNELPWAAQFGVDENLVRISVGLEETNLLQHIFQEALDAASAVLV